MDNQDWKAITSSEVFRNFVIAELQKEAEEEANKETPEQIEEREAAEAKRVLEAFGELESRLKKDPRLLSTFVRAKQAILQNAVDIEKVDPAFVEGLMMLDLPVGDED